MLESYDWPDESINPLSGSVRLSAKSRKDFDDLLEQQESKEQFDYAIVYVGSPRVKSGGAHGYRKCEVVERNA